MEATVLSNPIFSLLSVHSSLPSRSPDQVLFPSSLMLNRRISSSSSSSSPRFSVFAYSGSRFPMLQSINRSDFATSCSLSGAEECKEVIPTENSASEEVIPTENSACEEGIPIEKKFPAFPTVMGIDQILRILPHRFPFLLVDRVIEYNPGVSAVAIKNVTINDNFFPGHFPERPIMPGVLMVEAMAQVGGLVMLQPEVGGSRDNFFFAGVDKVRFRKPVVAGDTLVMRMTLIKLQKRFGIAKMEGKAYVGGELVCEGEFLMATGS